MIKRNLAILVMTGLGATLVTTRPPAGKPASSMKSTILDPASYANLVPVIEQNDSFSDTSISTVSKKTFNLPNINYQDYLILATTLYGEASGELDNEDYVKGVLSTILNRAEEKKSIRKAVLETTINQNGEKVYQYTCFDPRDPNYNRVMHLQISEIARKRDSVWQKCFSIASEALNDATFIEHPLNLATHFFVRSYDPRHYTRGNEARRKNVPSFAYEMNKDGEFILNERKERIPLKPVAVVPVKNGKKAFFYNIGD